MSDTALAAERRKYLGSLYDFAKDICGFSDLSPRLHGEVCEFISETLLKKKKHCGVIIPRDHFKSSLGQALCLQLFTREIWLNKNVDYRVLIDTATMELSQKHVMWIRRQLAANEKYRKLFGDFFADGIGFTQKSIYIAQRKVQGVTKEPNFQASSVRSEATGLHFDFHWYDDLIGEKNYDTKGLRQKAIDHYFNSLQLLEPTGLHLWTATRWHDGDVTGTLLKQQEELVREGKEPHILFMQKAALEKDGKAAEDGEPIFPERFPMEVMERKKKLPRRIWRSQWMNDPSIAEDAIPFNRENMYVPLSNFPDKLRLKVVTIDPNFRDEDRAAGDFCCIVVGGFDNWMNWWGMDVRMGNWTASQLIEQMFEVHRMWRPDTFRIERKMTSFLDYALRLRCAETGTFLPISWIDRDNRSKETRHTCLEPVFRTGKVKFAFEISEAVKREMEDELERVGASANDDFLDALADQINGITPFIVEDGKRSEMPRTPEAAMTMALGSMFVQMPEDEEWN